MNEFEKNQDKATQTDEQGKPAFGQFDKEQGEQGNAGQQQELGQKGQELGEGRQQEQGEIEKDELADAQQQGDTQAKPETDQGDPNR